MRSAIFLIMMGILIFGCIQMEQPAQPTAPTVVNVTQGTTPVTGTTTVEVNQTTTTQGSKTKTQDQLSSISQEEITYKTDDSWEIHGTLYHSKNTNPKKGVILLHQLGSDRSSYDPLVPELHDALPDADILAIDIRGHGESTNINTWQKFTLAGDYRAMSNDIEGAMDYLEFYRNIKDDFYVVGASIGSTSALNQAGDDAAIRAVVMLSPGMEYKGVDISESLEDYKRYLFIVAAKGDTYSASSAQTAYSESPSSLKKLHIYENMSAHGTDMFNASKGSNQGELTEMIADWLATIP